MALVDSSALAALGDSGEPRGARSVARDLAIGAGTVALVAGALVQRGVGARGLIDSAFLVVLVVLSAIDIERRVLPNRIIFPATGIILVAQLALFPDQALDWIVAPLGAAGVFFLLRLMNTQGLGLGDVKLMLLLGAALGKTVAPAVLAGAFAAGAWSLFLLVRHGSRARRMAFPYGPFLAFGAALAVLFVDPGSL